MNMSNIQHPCDVLGEGGVSGDEAGVMSSKVGGITVTPLRWCKKTPAVTRNDFWPFRSLDCEMVQNAEYQ